MDCVEKIVQDILDKSEPVFNELKLDVDYYGSCAYETMEDGTLRRIIPYSQEYWNVLEKVNKTVNE